ALLHILEQALIVNHLVAVKLQANQRAIKHGSNKQVVLPGFETLGVIEGHSAYGRRLTPDMMRRLCIRGGLTYRLRNGAPAVVVAVCRQGPTVISPWLWDVDFIAATRAMLVGPNGTAPGIERRTLLVAVAIRPDFRKRPVGVHEWIVLRHLAVRLD